MNCDTCKHFVYKQDRYYSGGFCKWKPPMILRSMTWGAHNERIAKPEEETCSEHKPK